MPTTENLRSPDELARVGSEVFDRRVRPVLRPEDNNRFVAIDIRSEDYEVDEDDYAAISRLRSRRPLAEVWLERAGQATAYRLGRGR